MCSTGLDGPLEIHSGVCSFYCTKALNSSAPKGKVCLAYVCICSMSDIALAGETPSVLPFRVELCVERFYMMHWTFIVVYPNVFCSEEVFRYTSGCRNCSTRMCVRLCVLCMWCAPFASHHREKQPGMVLADAFVAAKPAKKPAKMLRGMCQGRVTLW